MAVEPLDLEALRRYADAEALLVGWIEPAYAAAEVYAGTKVPQGDELVDRLPFVHVEAFGGSDVNPAQDVVHFDVDLYYPGDVDGNPDDAEAKDLAELLRAGLLYHLPGYYTDTATVSEVRTISRPCARPHDDTHGVTKIGAAYAITIKSRG